MAFAAAMGVDFTLSAVTMGAALLPVEEKPIARIGIGSTALGQTEDARTNGITPNLYLYDVRGNRFAQQGLGLPIEDGVNEKIEFMILDGGERTAAPEYLTIEARTSDATCVSYVTVTGAAGDERTWHAGYLKKCAAQGNGAFWYPSPNTIPDTDFRPGCMWLSQDNRFLQGVSVHLPSFGFPETAKAEAAGKQFDDFTDTLCKAPGRMSLYTELDKDYIDCIPYYDFIPEKFSEDEANEEEGKIEGYDKDFQKIVSGHKIPERNRKAVSCEFAKHKLFNQEFQPGIQTVTDTPLSRVQKEKEEAEAARKAEEERVRQEAEQQLNEAGKNPNGAPPGEGSFGGVQGSIPIDQVGTPVPVEETVENLEELQNQPTPSPAAPVEPIEPAEPTGIPGEPTIDLRKSKRQLQQRSENRKSTKNVLARREQLQAEGNYCVDRLTISHHADHSAREVCEMPNSWGADFVSMNEGLYCEMCERELYPLCADDQQQDCFDVDRTVLRSKEGIWQKVKNYIDVQVWRV